jgi:hypothetical protein
MIRALALLSLALLTGCQPPVMTYPEAVTFCTDRARSAAGPRGGAMVGFNSQDGPQAAIGFSFDQNFLAGRDPNAVYAACMDNLRANGQITGG